MRCASCGFENFEEGKFCIGCGAPFRQRCARCGFENRPQARFCDECGTALSGSPHPPAPRVHTQPTDAKHQRDRSSVGQSSADAEHRHLTVMFCDLVGSTALSTQLDPEDLREVVQAYQRTCADVIIRYEGHIAQYLGDGLLVYFGYPVAHEDDARRAVRAGLEILTAIQTLVPAPSQGAQRFSPSSASTEEGRGEGRLQVRISIHTGLVVIGELSAGSRSEHLALGETPNIAAHIQGLAAPNSVLLSATTHRLVSGAFECQPFGSHLVKGTETPLAVYQVQSERQRGAPGARPTT